MASSNVHIAMSQPESAPSSGIKWKALYDNSNAHNSNKILIRNTHTQELLPWYGFSRPQSGKDYLYTCVPLTSEQLATINKIEACVLSLLQQHSWSQRFTMTLTERVFPKTSDCVFYEKKEDGRLYRAYPDLEGELHNTPERSLSIGALLHITGVFFDFATDRAKLTFKLVCATYAWADNMAIREDDIAGFMSAFGEIATTTTTLPSLPPLPQNDDVVEAAVIASGVSSALAPLDKTTFMKTLSKIRTTSGIQKKLHQIKKRCMDAGLMEWCEAEARKAMFALSQKEAKKKVKPLTLQRDERHPADVFKVIDSSASTATSMNNDDDDIEDDIFSE